MVEKNKNKNKTKKSYPINKYVEYFETFKKNT